MRHTNNGCRNEVITIENDFDIEYLIYKEFKKNEDEYKRIAKLKTMDSLNISDSEKMTINSFLLIYEIQVGKIKRKLENEIIKETLY